MAAVAPCETLRRRLRALPRGPGRDLGAEVDTGNAEVEPVDGAGHVGCGERQEGGQQQVASCSLGHQVFYVTGAGLLIVPDVEQHPRLPQQPARRPGSQLRPE